MRHSAGRDDAGLEDALLVVRCQLGERGAFDALIARWAAPIAAYAHHVLADADAAAELSQDIWLGVVRGINRLRDPDRFRAWLFGIAHRAFTDVLRRRYRTLPTSDSDACDIADDEGADDRDVRAHIDSGLARLPPVEREILTLFYLQELTVEECAQALGKPIGTVKSRLHRARRLLRHELDEQGDLS